MSSWTVEQVLGLAPDGWAARAARDLGIARRWLALSRDAMRKTAWGAYQGTAATPYDVAVDLAGPAFTCTCPSRKSPCKHALGLMLLASADADRFEQAPPPEWVEAWLASRQKRAERGTALPAALPDSDREARARRREERISQGVADLDRWLQDLVRAGLAEAASRPWTAFEQMSARLVDAQAPGLARFVRDLGHLPHSTSNWPERMLIDVGQLALLTDGWRRLESLRPELQAEIRALAGINEPREAVLARPALHDVWDVLGRRLLEGERMRVQRTWLWGRSTRRWALLLDFSVAGQTMNQSVTPSLSFEADLCFYAGACPLRALAASPPARAGVPRQLPAQDIMDALTDYAGALGRNPWLERVPVAVQQVVPRRASDETWWLADAQGSHVRFDTAVGWHVMALSGGEPLDVFGEFDGFRLAPLSAWVDGELVQLGSLAEV